MTKRLIMSLMLGAGILALTAVSAAAMPVPPFSPYGTVRVKGANAPIGAEVTAWCGGVQYGQTAVSLYEGKSWYFNLDVWGDDPETAQTDGCTEGQTVSFKIGEEWANETAPWSSSSPQLDLTVGPPILRVYLPLVWR